jgi:hypothetical protein
MLAVLTPQRQKPGAHRAAGALAPLDLDRCLFAGVERQLS